MLLFIGYHVGFNKGLDYGLHAKVEILLSKDTSEVIKHLKEESDQDWIDRFLYTLFYSFVGFRFAYI